MIGLQLCSVGKCRPTLFMRVVMQSTFNTRVASLPRMSTSLPLKYWAKLVATWPGRRLLPFLAVGLLSSSIFAAPFCQPLLLSLSPWALAHQGGEQFGVLGWAARRRPGRDLVHVCLHQLLDVWLVHDRLLRFHKVMKALDFAQQFLPRLRHGQAAVRFDHCKNATTVHVGHVTHFSHIMRPVWCNTKLDNCDHMCATARFDDKQQWQNMWNISQMTYHHVPSQLVISMSTGARIHLRLARRQHMCNGWLSTWSFWCCRLGFYGTCRSMFRLSRSAGTAAMLLLAFPLGTIIGKSQSFATFLPFRASASSFFWLFLFSDFLSSNLSLLSASALLCFSSVHIVGSLTSKFPFVTLSFYCPHTVWGLLQDDYKRYVRLRQRYGFFLCLSRLLCALYCTQAGCWLPGLRYHQLVFAAPVMPGATSWTLTFWRNAKPENRMCHATSLQCD